MLFWLAGEGWNQIVGYHRFVSRDWTRKIYASHQSTSLHAEEIEELFVWGWGECLARKFAFHNQKPNKICQFERIKCIFRGRMHNWFGLNSHGSHPGKHEVAKEQIQAFQRDSGHPRQLCQTSCAISAQSYFRKNGLQKCLYSPRKYLGFVFDGSSNSLRCGYWFH